MPRFARFTLLVGLIIATAASAAPAAPFAYITNSVSGSVTVVDVATDTVSGTPIAVRGIPGGVVVNADATRVYVSSWGASGAVSNLVSVIDTAGRTVLAEIPLPNTFPAGLALTPDGSRLFVTHTWFTGPTLTVIDTATNAVVTSLVAGTMNGGVVVHPGGSKLYIGTGNGVLVYHPTTLAPLGWIATGHRAYGLAFAPGGGTLYVASYSGNTVSVVETATDTIRAEVFTGSGPFALSVSPDGGRLFVANQRAGTVSIVDTTSLTVLHDVPLGGGQPWGLQSGPDGSRVYVADFTNGKVLVIDAATGTVAAQITVGNSPIAFGEFIRVGAVPTALNPGGITPAEVIVGASTPVSLRAVLTRGTGGAAIPGATIQFFIDGAGVGSAVTGGDGAAVLTVNPAGLSAGPHTVSARFAGGAAGGALYGASTTTLGTLRAVYAFSGFLPPVRPGLNERGAGAMIIAKWRLFTATGAPLIDPAAVAAVSLGTMACGGAGPASWSAAPGSLSYDPADGTFTYRWKTEKSFAGSCVRLRVTLADGMAYTADFSLR